MSDLARPVFIVNDPAMILSDMIAEWEVLAGKTLHPAQADRLFIDMMAYRESLVLSGIQSAAEQNLLNFAAAPVLDYIGDLWGVERLAGTPASIALVFSIDAPRQADTIIPLGTQVSNQSSQGLVFVTREDAAILAGETTATVTATALEIGSKANTVLEGQIKYLLDTIGLSGVSVTNSQAAQGGADFESDDQLRERIKLAPEAISTCGSRLSYKFHARSASPSIIDVSVSRGGGGLIDIYVLTDTGVASQAIIDLVDDACSADHRRPLSDRVIVQTATAQDYVLSIEVTPYSTANRQVIAAHVRAAAEALAGEKRLKLGQDIEPSQIIDRLFTQGVYKIEVTSPVKTLEVPPSAWANCTDIQIQIKAGVDG